jgi:GT2 family glycosyltransferase
MKKQPKVVIIVVVYNPAEKLIRECLDSIKKKTNYNNYKVIVSDNGSVNDVQNWIKKDYKWVYLLENKKNLSYAGGNNAAMKYAIKKYNPDYFFILNDDMKIINKNWLEEVVKTAESDPKIGLVGINPVYPDGTSQNPGGYIKGFVISIDKEVEGLREFDHVTGVFLIKRKLLDKIGLFDEIFIPYLLEETDYCLRAKRAGFRVMSRADVKIIHYKSQTISRDSELKINSIRLKNDLIFSIMNLKPFFAILRIFFYLPLVMLLKKKDEKKGVSIRNAKFRENLGQNLLILLRGYYNMLRTFRSIYKKRLERKRNKKIWY